MVFCGHDGRCYTLVGVIDTVLQSLDTTMETAEMITQMTANSVKAASNKKK